MQPVTINAQPYKAIAALAGGAVIAGGLAATVPKLVHALDDDPSNDPDISKGEFAAYMLGSVAVGGGLLIADKVGGMDALARLANSVSKPGIARGGAAALSGAALGATVCALPGMLLATGWGWIGMLADD